MLSTARVSQICEDMLFKAYLYINYSFSLTQLSDMVTVEEVNYKNNSHQFCS